MGDGQRLTTWIEWYRFAREALELGHAEASSYATARFVEEQNRLVAPDPAARVLSWRIEQLISVGFASDDAFVLALDRSVDLHEARALVRRGCPPQTAFRILV